MIQQALAGLANLSPEAFLYMLVGIIACQVVVIIPGLGGHFILVLLLPFMYVLEPMAAIAMLVGASVTTGTGNTITSVLFGVPGSPTGVATIFDGYPMAQRGEGARAVAAGLTASALGGIVGALILVAMLPIVRPVVLALGSPEYFILILAALLAMGYLGEADAVRAWMMGGLGLLLSFVGQEGSTGALRYTFDFLILWDGIDLAAAFIGLFAIAEMMHYMRRGGAVAGSAGEFRQDPANPLGSALAGVKDAVIHWRTTLQSSGIGMIIGMLPGVGAGASQFMAYTAAARTSSNRAQFGDGAVEGVIAADAAVNATDAGQMIPTLAFGIPGSATAAILLAGFIAAGIQPGPAMLQDNLDIVWTVIWILVLANIIATSMCLLIARHVAKLTLLPAAYLIPAILTLSFVGSYMSVNDHGAVVIAIIFGILGYLMRNYGYSRATLVMGFVLGGIAERHFLLARELFGYAFLLRPITLALIAGLVLVLALPPVLSRVRTSRRKPGVTAPADHGPPADGERRAEEEEDQARPQ